MPAHLNLFSIYQIVSWLLECNFRPTAQCLMLKRKTEKRWKRRWTRWRKNYKYGPLLVKQSSKTQFYITLSICQAITESTAESELVRLKHSFIESHFCQPFLRQLWQSWKRTTFDFEKRMPAWLKLWQSYLITRNRVANAYKHKLKVQSSYIYCVLDKKYFISCSYYSWILYKYPKLLFSFWINFPKVV